MIPFIFLFLTLYINPHFTEASECHPPDLDNGYVEAEEGANGNFFKGIFRCNPGFTLSGPSMLKCRNGIWSGVKPVCSVTGCDPKDLPKFANGRKLKVKGTRDSVFKYRCNKGFRLFGPKNVYCTKNGWKLDELPVCTRFGCDESGLLGNGVPHGRYRSMFQGAVYRFYCESGSMMDGNSAVYCDGYKWNGTKPECLVPPTTPVLSLELDGVEVSEPLAAVGQEVKLVCNAQGGNPFPDLTFMLDGERVEADNKDMIPHGYSAVHTFIVEKHHANLDISCIAENRLTSLPVGSNHQKLNLKFGPSNSYIHGDEMEMLTPNTDATFSCSSAESNPASNITVEVKDQDGNDISLEITKLPKMKGNVGFASAVQFGFHVSPLYSFIIINCTAENDESQASSSHVTYMAKEPESIEITGPEFLLETDDEQRQNNNFICTVDGGHPNAAIEWVVKDEHDSVPDYFIEEELNNESQVVSILRIPSIASKSVTAYCVASVELLGYIQESDHLNIGVLSLPKDVLILGPDFLLLNTPADFECVDSEEGASNVSFHVYDSQEETLEFTKIDDYRIHVSIQEPQDSITVECFATNLVGTGPYANKRIPVLYAPKTQVEGLEHFQASMLPKYSCSTTNFYPESTLTWSVTDQDGQDVEFKELFRQLSDENVQMAEIEVSANKNHHQLVIRCNSETPAGKSQSEIVVYAVEPPQTVKVVNLESDSAGSELVFECLSPLSNPKQQLRWEAYDALGEFLRFDEVDQGLKDGSVYSRISILPHESAHVVSLTCIAENDLGYVQDALSVQLSYDPAFVTIDGPTNVESNEEVIFKCSAGVAYPAPTLRWFLNGEDVSDDAEQTDTLEEDGATQSVSRLTLWPEVEGQQQLLKCSVSETQIQDEFIFNVKESAAVESTFPQQESNAAENEDSYETQDPQYEQEYMTTDENYDMGATGYYETPESEHENGIREEDYDMNTDTPQGIIEESDTTTDENITESEVDDGYQYDTDEYEYEEDYNEYEYDDEKVDYEGDNYKFDETFENPDKEEDSKYETNAADATREENQVETNDYLQYDNEAFFAAVSEEETTKQYENNKHFSENSFIVNSSDDFDATSEDKAKEDNKLVEEEMFESNSMEEVFAAAEPESKVVPLDSDSNRQNSADLFRPKQLYASSGTNLILSKFGLLFLFSLTRLVTYPTL